MFIVVKSKRTIFMKKEKIKNSKKNKILWRTSAQNAVDCKIDARCYLY
jgi:hypothetical protein